LWTKKSSHPWCCTLWPYSVLCICHEGHLSQMTSSFAYNRLSSTQLTALLQLPKLCQQSPNQTWQKSLYLQIIRLVIHHIKMLVLMLTEVIFVQIRVFAKTLLGQHTVETSDMDWKQVLSLRPNEFPESVRFFIYCAA
jgi:hypothetical protein